MIYPMNLTRHDIIEILLKVELNTINYKTMNLIRVLIMHATESLHIFFFKSDELRML